LGVVLTVTDPFEDRPVSLLSDKTLSTLSLHTAFACVFCTSY